MNGNTAELCKPFMDELRLHQCEVEYILDVGIRRWCKHSSLLYLGMYAVRDLDDLASFQTKAAVAGAREFALSLNLITSLHDA